MSEVDEDDIDLEVEDNPDSGKFHVDRSLTKDILPPGKATCNARRKNFDSYCQSPGIEPFQRCATHLRNMKPEMVDLFKQALPVERAKQLETLLNDSLNMDGELASGKAILLQELENYTRASHYVHEYISNAPRRPTPDDPDFENELQSYKHAVDLHMFLLDKAERLKVTSYKSAQSMIKTLTEAVSKNHKVKEGSKFQLDVKQISRLLRIQLEAHKVCKGCSTLPEVVKYLKEHTKDIPLNPNFSKGAKEAVGRRAYREMLEEVESRIPNMEDADFDNMEDNPLETE